MPIYGENDKFTCIRCNDGDEWLRQRTLGVGGSDVAAIVGVSPWKTATLLWLEKTGRSEQDDISERPYVQFGNVMEPLVGKWYAEQHPDRTVRRVNAICKSVARPWAQASLDYEVKDGDRWGVLEIKTARSKKDWQDGVPTYYLTQVTHYMSVTSRTFADVAVFFRDTCEYGCYRVEYDQEDGALVDAAVDDFWLNYVEKDVMPKVVGTDGEVTALTSYYGSKNDELLTVDDPSVDELISEYKDAAEREKSAKADKTKASAKLMELIGGYKGIKTSVAKVTWVRTNREAFDSKRFKSEHPDVWREYSTRHVSNGGMRITKVG